MQKCEFFCIFGCRGVKTYEYPRTIAGVRQVAGGTVVNLLLQQDHLCC